MFKLNKSTKQDKVLNDKQYSKLLFDIQDIIETGIDKPSKDNISQLTISYWKIGQRINKESLSTKSGYHNSILKDLSNEIGLNRSTLSRCLKFFRIYDSPPKNQNLSWSHYRALLAIKDDKLRFELEQLAQKEDWSREKLVAAIKRKQNQDQSETKNQIITRPTNPTYLYQAQILEVIDGDTLLLNIDLGFQVNKEQRVRLANIDCKEIHSEKGQDAYHFLRDKLGNIDKVMIQTKKIDIYGRYLGHIFYDPNPQLNKFDNAEIFEKGVYLNEEIIRKGFGEVF